MMKKMKKMKKMNRTASIVIAVAAWSARAATPLSAPADERIPELAAELESVLASEIVEAPDGSSIAVAGGTGGSPSLLDAGRIETCLRTIGAADAWPEAWLVVQVESVTYDLVLPVRLDDRGAIVDPAPVFTVLRREWTVEGLRDAIRDATGRKSRGRTWNLVVQGFRTRVENRFVYELPEERRGLLALFPEGTLLLEARLVELPDGRRFTLALVLQQAELVPSTCGDCASRIFGHADTGRVVLVLTDDTEIRDQVDLTEMLSPPGGRPLLPRYRCEPADSDPEERGRSIDERFSNRERVPLVVPRDLDGDGWELEIELIAGVEACEAETLTLAVVPAPKPKLYIVPR